MGTRIACLLVLTTALTAPAWANTFNWTDVAGSFDGTFSDANHWSPTGTPGAGDDVLFNNGQTSPYTVTLTTDAVLGTNDLNNLAGSFNVQDDQVIVDLGTFDVDLRRANSPGGLNADVNDGLNVGLAGQTAVLTITSSALTNKGAFGAGSLYEAYVGSGAGADGTIRVTNGATWTTTGSGSGAHFGLDGGSGTLDVDGGVADIFGSAMRWSDGDDSAAHFTVHNGGQLLTSSNISMARSGSSTTNITIDGAGAGAQWDHAGNREITFGGTGVGAGVIDVRVINAGVIDVASGFEHERVPTDGPTNMRGSGKTVDFLISGAGSRLSVGFYYAGGNRSRGNANVGGSPVGDAAVESFHILTIADGGLFQVSQALKIFEAAETWAANGKPGDDSTVILDNGTIEVDGAAYTQTKITGSPIVPAEVLVRGILKGNGTIQRRAGSGVADIAVNVDSMGRLLPGDVTDAPAAGLLTIGDMDLNHAGTVGFDLAGTATSRYDRIVLQGAGATATFTGGSIEIGIITGYDAFRITAGDTFDLLTASSILGAPSLTFLDPHFDGFLSVIGSSGDAQTLQLTLTQVPEPAAAMVLAWALAWSLKRPGRDMGASS